MQKGDKCLALTIWEGKPLWVVGRLHDVLEMKTQKSTVIAVRKDFQKLVGGNGVLVVPPYFCYASITDAGNALEEMGKSLDSFARSYVPEEDQPPLVIDEDSSAFGTPQIARVSPGLVLDVGQGSEK